MVSDAAWPGSEQRPPGTAPAAGPVGRLDRPSASDPWAVVSFLSLGCPRCARVCGVLGHLTPARQCARSVRCFACALSRATWLLFTGVPARCVVLRVRCPGALGSCSPVCPPGVLCWVCGVLGPLAPVHWCARSACCVVCAVSWATWLLFTGVPAQCVVLRVRCLGPPGSCSPVFLLGALLCVCCVPGHLAPVYWCSRSACCVACAVSSATWLLFTHAPAWCVAVRVRCLGPLDTCSSVCPLSVSCCVCGVLGHLAPVHRCARSVCCVACAVSWAPWLLFTSVPARCVALRVRRPGPLGTCSPVCLLGYLCCVCGVLGHLAPVHQCACLVRCCACAVPWATWLLFTGVPARFVVLLVRCPGPLGSCSPVPPLGALFCFCCVLGHLAPVHRCARSMCCVACAVSWATWLLFTDAPDRFVVLRVRCPGPLGSCSPVSPLGVLCWVCGVLGPLAPVHPCPRSVCSVGCAVSWATWLLFTGVPAGCAVLGVRCLGPLGSCSPVCLLGVLCCAYGVLAPWLLFTSVLAPCVYPWVACAGKRCEVHTRPSGQRLFVAGRGWVPSGRALVHPDGGCFVAGRGCVPSGRALVHLDGGCSVAGRGWVRCRARTPLSGRQLVLLGTCSLDVVRCAFCALSGFAAPGRSCCLAPVRVPWLWPAACLSGVPRGPAWCAAPRPVRSLSVVRLAFLMPWCLCQHLGLAPPALLGGCAGHAEAGQEPGSLCSALAPAEAGTLGSLRIVPVRGPAMVLSLAGPSGVGLGLRALRWLACVDPVTDASGFPYRPSFDGGLGRCTGAVSCGRRHSPCRSVDATPGSQEPSCTNVTRCKASEAEMESTVSHWFRAPSRETTICTLSKSSSLRAAISTTSGSGDAVSPFA